VSDPKFLAEVPEFELPLPRGRRWRLGRRPALLGIINVTPDSFSDGGRHFDPEGAVRAGLTMLAEGADALDIGGESTRPGAAPVTPEEQLRRILPVIGALRRETGAPLSVDTRSPRVAEAALEAGADCINDISACWDPGWLPLLEASSGPIVLMHMRGTPEDMQQRTDYPRGVLPEIVEFLAERIADLTAAGVSSERIIVDPGIGFAKTAAQNLEILDGLGALRALARPVLVGASRKLFLGKLLGAGRGGQRRPEERDVATVAANVIAAAGGASILRVHNVAFARDLADVIEGLRLARQRSGATVERGAEP
jgi:dihydropteroate synthase